MKPPVAQTRQPAVIHARPDAAVAALKPRAHAVAGQPVLHGEPLIPSVRRDVKQAVAIMIEPHAAGAVLMHAHGPARGRAQQPAPLRRLPPSTRGPPFCATGRRPAPTARRISAGTRHRGWMSAAPLVGVIASKAFPFQRAISFSAPAQTFPRASATRVYMALPARPPSSGSNLNSPWKNLQYVSVAGQKPQAVFRVGALKDGLAGRREGFSRRHWCPPDRVATPRRIA